MYTAKACNRIKKAVHERLFKLIGMLLDMRLNHNGAVLTNADLRESDVLPLDIVKEIAVIYIPADIDCCFDKWTEVRLDSKQIIHVDTDCCFGKLIEVRLDSRQTIHIELTDEERQGCMLYFAYRNLQDSIRHVANGEKKWVDMYEANYRICREDLYMENYFKIRNLYYI